MNNFQLKLHTETKHLALTSKEKSAMRAALMSAMNAAPQHAEPTPYLLFLWSMPRMALAGLLLLFALGGSAAYAAGGALPGDALYSVKIGVAEPIEGAMQFSPEAKATWHASVALRRVEEAETLAATGKLTPVTAATIESNFDSHADAATSLTNKAGSADSPQKEGLSADIAARLAAHSNVLSTLGEQSANAEVAASAAKLAGAVSQHATELLAVNDSEEPDNTGTTAITSTTAPTDGPSDGDVSRPMTMSMTAPEQATTSSSTPKIKTGPEARSSASTDTAASTSVQGTTTRLAPPALRTGTSLRDRASAALTLLQKRLDGASDAIDAGQLERIRADIDAAQKLIAAGDAATDQKSRMQDYARALSTAISLTTYLNAHAAFPQANILPALLKKEQ